MSTTTESLKVSSEPVAITVPGSFLEHVRHQALELAEMRSDETLSPRLAREGRELYAVAEQAKVGRRVLTGPADVLLLVVSDLASWIARNELENADDLLFGRQSIEDLEGWTAVFAWCVSQARVLLANAGQADPSE